LDAEESLVAFLVSGMICMVLWIAVTGGGFFWPVYPMLFSGFNLVKTVVQRGSVIEREVLRLESRWPRAPLRNSPLVAVTRTRHGRGDGAAAWTFTMVAGRPATTPAGPRHSSSAGSSAGPGGHRAAVCAMTCAAALMG
jgi:hypothetical protein